MGRLCKNRCKLNGFFDSIPVFGYGSMYRDILAEDIRPNIKCSLMGFWFRGVGSQVDHEKAVLGYFSTLNVNIKQ